MVTQVLAGLRVLDFSNVRTGAQVGQTLADFGAEVILIERPGGSRLREEAAWPFWSRGKRSITLDLASAEDRAIVQELAKAADIVVEAFEPGVADRLGIGYETLRALNPGLIYGSITGFGRENAFSDLPGYEGLVAAKFGVNWTLEGMADRPGPAFCTVAYPSYAASQLLLQGILAALYEREESGLGQWVETSLVEALTIYDTYGWAMRTAAVKFGGGGMKQVPRVLDGVPTGGLSFRLLIALTKDGEWLQFSQTPDRLFRAMMRLFGLEWMFDDPEWAEIPNFESIEKRKEFWEILLNIVRSKTAAEWAADFDREPDVWGEQFRRGSDLLRHPQMEWNKMVIAPTHEGFGEVRQPGPIAHMSNTPAHVMAPPPAIGADDAQLRSSAGGTSAPAIAATRDAAGLPLAGVTIVELATFYAAPYGATLLGELGARVIKLEELGGEPQRNMMPFPEVAGWKALLGKESVAVDLATPEGREIAHRIIAKSDIVLQSFRGGAAKRLGLDPETLRALNPNLIYHSAPGYGVDGPYARRPAFAPTIGAAAGLAWRNAGSVIPTGELELAEIEPASMQLGTAVMGVGNADGMSAVTAATTMMLGLLARRRGLGAQDLFTSMLSSVAHGLSEVMVEFDGQPVTAEADTSLYGMHALYRLYETAEEWVFLAAPRERDWDRLVEALPGAATLAADPRFATAADRTANDAELAEALSSLLRAKPAAEWETLLRGKGVACVLATRGPVEANYMDEGMGGRILDLVTPGSHPILGDMERLKPLIRFSRSATVAKDASLVGQETEAVLREFGYADSEIAALSDKGVILLG